MATGRLDARSGHYYWLTALLAARGAQRRTSRMLAGVVFGLGLIPTIVLASPIGPTTALGRALCVGVTVSCIAVASRWLRHSWPSSTESIIANVFVTICISIISLVLPDPLAGFLGATAFVAVAAFAACFHSRELILVTGALAVFTLAVLTVRMAQRDPALAFCALLLVSTSMCFSAFTARMVIHVMKAEMNVGDIEPLTGLLNRDAFYERTATLLGTRDRDDDRFLVIAVLNIDGYSVLTSMSGDRGANQARVAVGSALRATARNGAIVAHTGEAEFLIADTFTLADSSPLFDRIRSALANPAHMTASIGVVSVELRPLNGLPPHDVVDEILTLAATAMYAARKSGGDQAHYVINPKLSAADGNAS